jgi:hypothetical protein
MRDRIGGRFEQLALSFYETVRAAEPDLDRFWDISDVFDKRSEQIWIDATGHVTPEGNRLVAEEMLERIYGASTPLKSAEPMSR